MGQYRYYILHRSKPYSKRSILRISVLVRRQAVVMVMVFKTFNNISVISWRSFLSNQNKLYVMSKHIFSSTKLFVWKGSRGIHQNQKQITCYEENWSYCQTCENMFIFLTTNSPIVLQWQNWKSTIRNVHSGASKR